MTNPTNRKRRTADQADTRKAPFLPARDDDRDAHVQTYLPAAEFKLFSAWQRRIALSQKQAARFALWYCAANDIRPEHPEG